MLMRWPDGLPGLRCWTVLRPRLWFAGLLALLAMPGLAEVPATPQPRQITVADGLPSSSINAFAEDGFGYLWLASRDGLARFDGRNYRIWRANDGLRDNLVWSLHVDAHNRLWVGTQNAGLAMLPPERDQFVFYDRQGYPQMGSNTVWSIKSTPDGSLWFGTSTAGLHRLAADGTLTRFMPVPGDARSLPSAAVGYLAVTADGSLWVGTKGGLARWDGSGFERVEEGVLPSRRINGLKVDRQDRLWIATNHGVAVRHANGEFQRTRWRGMAAGDVLNVLQYSGDGNYWLDTRQGLGRMRLGDVQNVPLYSAQERGLVKPNWSSAHEDREGGMWFASTNAGLWHLPPNWRQFSVFSRLLDDPSSLRNPYALALAPSASGGIWISGTRGALDRLDPLTGKVEHHLASIDGNNWPQSMVEDRLGRVWIGSLEALVRYDPATGQTRRWDRGSSADAALPGDGDVVQVCDGGTLWVYSESGGLQQRNLDGRVLRYLPPGSSGLPFSGVADMRCGPQDRLWLASEAGLLAWVPERAGFERLPGSTRDRVYTFRVTDAGVVWVAGLGHMDQYLWDGQRLALLDSIGAEREFPALAPGGLVVDSDGVAWASSARGLIRIDPASRSVRLYGVHDGLPGQEFRRRALVQASTGQIAGGTPEGVVLYDPSLLKPSRRQPPLVIERVSVRRDERLHDLTGKQPLEIEDGDRDLHIVARLLSFADSATNSYRFRLGGYDQDWVEVGATGERLFSRLPPGHYRLEVQAKTSDNVWSKMQTLDFHVQPPWWRSAAGLTVLIALGGALLVFSGWLYRRRLRRISQWQLARHKQELAEQASEAKTRFLATLGHEIRTPMTGVMGMSELLQSTRLDEQQRGYADSIRRAGEHLLRLVNDALDLARIEAGRLELQQQPFGLQPLLADVRALMEPLARRNGLEFVSDCPLPEGVQLQGDALRLQQILLNLLNNAIKFTRRGSVTLQVALEPGGRGVHFHVRDTGPGINAEQRQRLFRRFEQAEGARTTARYGGSGLGLAICNELVTAMGGGIGVASSPGRGACFSVSLPLPWWTVAGAASNRTPATSGHERALPALCILLVEDDATIAQVICGLLMGHGHQVVHVPHGLAALSEVSSRRFDVALLDLDLPGIDGLGLAQQLRAQGQTLPLVAVTARSDAEAEPQTRAAGFDAFLRKPVTAQMLLDVMATVLEHRHLGTGN